MAKISENRYPIYDQNGCKTIPFGSVYTYIAHMREYHPPPGLCAHLHKQKFSQTT